MKRRSFLNSCTASLALLSACKGSIPGPLRASIEVSPQTNSELELSCSRIYRPSITIDMHCHIMNNWDVNGHEFVVRNHEGFSTDESLGPIVNTGISQLLRAIRTFSILKLPDGATENDYLGSLLDKKITDRSNICGHLSLTQPKLDGIETYEPDGRGFAQGRLTGFLSTRSRNASILMNKWPEIDIFMPAIVDLYLGRSKGKTRPWLQMELYSKLSLLTNGRILPLMSFNPEREHLEGKVREREYWENGATLGWVRTAIEKQGAIGVKLHPSSGFDPARNSEIGCKNNRWSWNSKLPTEVGEKYDVYLHKLYRYCQMEDVPILTHGSTGVSAKEKCMQFNDEPLTWVNSTAHWIEISRKYPELKICIAHFASRFIPVDEDGNMVDKNGNLKPHLWLQRLLDEYKVNPYSNLYLDLSHMVELAVSSHADRGSKGARYAEAFKKFMLENPVLFKKVLYGSDDHMPEVSKIGVPYPWLIEKALPKRSRSGVMGENAVEFFGLKRGKNRKRLEQFFNRNDVTIDWADRI